MKKREEEEKELERVKREDRGRRRRHSNQEWLREKGFRFVSREQLNGERRLNKGLTWCEKYKIVIDVTM